MLQSIFIFISFATVKGFNFNANNAFRYSLSKESHYNLFSQTGKVLTPFTPLSPLYSTIKNSDTFDEDLTYLKEEFFRIGNGKTKISYDEFLSSEGIQSVLVEASEYKDDIQEIWISQAKSFDVSIDVNQFIAINREVDDLFEYIDDDEEEEESVEEEEPDEAQRLSDVIEGKDNEFEDGEIMEIKNIDMWDPDFNPNKYFDLEFLQYLRNFFDLNVDKDNGLLLFTNFYLWKDIQQMLSEGD
jgi:hypothetical protein